MSILDNLTPEQHQAITYKAGHLLIVAGAGTGKTSVITKRLAWLIDQGLAKADEILALTFTDKAAGEMEERVDKLLPYGFVDLWISTFHAFGDRVLRAHGLDIGLSNDFKLLNQTQTWLLIRENLDKFDLEYYRPLGNPVKFIHALIKHFSRCKDELISPEEYLNYAENLKLNSDDVFSQSHNNETMEQWNIDEAGRLREVANAFHTYNQLLLDNNALDFGDLINYALKLFQTRPNILEKYRRQFKYILVDEFQDTNLAQYELIKLLASPRDNLTVVGDDDQAIFKFRGASVSNILHFRRDYPCAASVTLTTNFRSPQNILDASYKLIKNNDPDRLEVKLGLNKKLSAFKSDRGIMETITAPTGEAEAKAVMEKIIALKNDQTAWSDFAVLIRSNAAADAFMAIFERQRIPYDFLASSGLYRQKVVLDILAYLRLLDNYHESAALYRVLNMPIFGIETSDLIILNHYAKKKSLSLYEAARQAPTLELSDTTRSRLEAILTLMSLHASRAREESVGKIILAFLQESGYLKDLGSRAEKGEWEAIRQINYLKSFYDNVTKFESNHDEKSVRHFLAEFTHVLDSGDEGSMGSTGAEGPDAVKIMTVHSAKGLEFQYVFAVNLVQLKFPAQNRGDAIELPDQLIKEIMPEGDSHLEEERRLFYVAMTRAKKGLFLSYAHRYDNGVRKRKPSIFLFETGLIADNAAISKEEALDFSRGIPAPQPRSSFVPPAYYSFTQLHAFETCPLQYKFAHILRVPAKGNAVFSFGKTMHGALQKFFEVIIAFNSVQQADLFSADQKKEIQAPPLDSLLEMYEACWIDDWYQDKRQKEEYKEKGRRLLKQFYESHHGIWPLPKFLEVGFHLKIGDLALKGQIDRIDQLPDGAFELIDYKTGSPPKDDKKFGFEDKEQLLIYQLAARDALKINPSKLSYYYLENNTKLSFLGTDLELQKLQDKLLTLADEIKTSDFIPDASIYHCRACDFKEICEYAEY